MPRESQLPLALALTRLLIALALPGVALPQNARGATPLEVVRTVRAQGCGGHTGTHVSLRLIGGLSEAALNASHGMSLKSAVAQSGYREQESSLLHVSGDAAALQHALANALCETVTASRFSDVGIAQRGHEI